LAEAQRQQAGRQRIQAAGVAALRGAEQVAGALQRLVGTQAARLVEQHDAVELAEPGARRFAHAWDCRGRACALVGAASAASYRLALSTREKLAAEAAATRGRSRGLAAQSSSPLSDRSRSRLSMRSPRSTESS